MTSTRTKTGRMRGESPVARLAPGATRYWTNGKGFIHRDDGPAIEYDDGSKVWATNGEYHRLDGPAYESVLVDFSCVYFVRGKAILEGTKAWDEARRRAMYTTGKPTPSWAPAEGSVVVLRFDKDGHTREHEVLFCDDMHGSVRLWGDPSCVAILDEDGRGRLGGNRDEPIHPFAWEARGGPPARQATS